MLPRRESPVNWTHEQVGAKKGSAHILPLFANPLWTQLKITPVRRITKNIAVQPHSRVDFEIETESM